MAAPTTSSNCRTEAWAPPSSVGAVSHGARAVLLRGYQRLTAAPTKEWANGRSAREVLSAMRTARAVRLGPGTHGREAMTVLTAEDARIGLDKKFPQAV